jgi:hypothetical protein
VEFLKERLNLQILEGTPKAKAAFWPFTDTEMRKRGERRRLDTSVVHALNDEDSLSDCLLLTTKIF